MTIYVDTSAFIALLDQDSNQHRSAARTWSRLLESDVRPVTCNYVVVETCALLQKRFGARVLRRFLEDVLPAVMVEWVDVPIHAEGIGSLLTSSRQGPNIVDCASFAVMRKLGTTDVFTFDRHFGDQGFSAVTTV